MALSDIVQQFINQHVHSVDQLEILLLLRRNSTRYWTAEEVSQALSTGTEAVASRLAQLTEDGLLAAMPAGVKQTYRYSARTAQLDAAVAELESAYPTYRVSIINLIFSKPIDKIRTFADAFRIHKSTPEEEDK
jgi:hypothetical protein